MNTVTKVAMVMVLAMMVVGQALAVDYVRHTAPAEYPGAGSPKWAGALDFLDDAGPFFYTTPEVGLNTEEGPLPLESEYFEGDRVTITANLPDYIPGFGQMDIYVFSVSIAEDGEIDMFLVWPGSKVGYNPSLYGPGPYGGPFSGNLVATHQEDLNHDDPGVVTRRVPIMDFVYGSAFPSDLTVYNVVKVVPAGAYPFWSHHWFTNEAGEWVQGDPYWVNMYSIHTVTLRAGESPLDNLEAPEYVRLRSGEPREIVLSSTVELGDGLVRGMNEAGFDVVVNNGHASGSITLTARESVPNGTLVPFVFRIDGHREVVWVCKNDADIEPRDVTGTVGVDVTSNELVGDHRQLEVWVGNETTRFNMQFGGRIKQVFSQDAIKAKRDYPDNISRVNVELPSSMQDSHFHLAFLTEDGSYIEVRGQKGYPEEIALERPTVTPSIITIDGSEDPPYYLRSTGDYANVEVIVTSDDFRIVRDESYTGEGDRWIIQLVDPHATGEVPYSFEFVFSDEDGDVVRIVRGEIHIEADPGSGGTEEPVPGDEGDGEGPAITIVAYSPPSVTTETEAFTVNFTVEDSDGVGDVHVTYDMGGERIATFALSDDGSNLVKTSDTATSCTYRFSVEPTGEVGEFHYSVVAFDSYGSRTEHDGMVPVVGPEDEDLLPPEITNIRINDVLTNSRNVDEPRVVISGEVYDDVSGVATTHLELSGATSMTTPTVADNSFSWELSVGVGVTTGEIVSVDNAGREARVAIEITYHPPVAEMVITAPPEIYEETAVTLTATGAAGSQWIWKVDGEEVVSAGYEATPSAGSLQITFPDSGWYTVSVEVRNDDGILFGEGSRAVQVLVDGSIPPSPVVSVSGPTSVVEGGVINLSASTSGGSDSSYTWAALSGGSFVALSSATGTSISVTGVSAGTVQLRATGVDTGVSATHTVTVVAGVTPTVVISGPGAVEVGSGITLTATTTGGSDSGYSWSQIGGSGSVSISGSGSSVTVTGVSAGAVTIQATGMNTGVSATHTVQVSDTVSYRVGISGPGSVTVGSSITLTATTDGTTEGYSWYARLGDSKVNIVDNHNGTITVTGLEQGTAVIRATGNTTGLYDEHSVAVYPTVDSEVTVSGPINLDRGETELYEAITTGGSDSGYTWVSTNTSVATVTAGYVTAVGSGTTTIRATGNDTGVTGQMVVTVAVSMEPASIETWDGSSASLEVPVGTSFTPGVRVKNADGSGLQGVSVTVYIYLDGSLYTGGTASNPQTTNTLVDGVAKFGTNSWQLTEPGCFGFRFVVERDGSPDLVCNYYRYTPGEYVAMP